MIVSETSLRDLFTIDFDPQIDDRGSFTRVFDRSVLLDNGLVFDFPQHGLVRNPKHSTLRGMHYQTAPLCETKIVHCLRGAVWDVILDVRRSSATFGRWEAFDLSETIPRALYVGAGLAHGYITLRDCTDLYYLLSAQYSAAHATGVHWRDPQAAITWPTTDVTISARDAALPYLAESRDPLAQ